MEGAALKLGAAVAQHAARSWLARRRDRTARSDSLAELANAQLTRELDRRKLGNLVERIGNDVTEQLQPLLDTRFAALPENEVTAAVLAVVDVLGKIELSDETLLAADADPEQLARRLRTQFPGRPVRVTLAEDAWPVYELALDQACRHLVQVVRHLPSFQPRALAEVLARLSAQSDQLAELLARVPRTSLHAPRGTNHDDEFQDAYFGYLARTLDRLELIGLPAEQQPNLALTVAYLSLSVSTHDGMGAHVRRSPDKWFEHLTETRQADGVPVEAAIGDAARTLLRGDAGSGKTTLLSWLAVTAARCAFTGALAEWNGSVPFVIRLRSFASGELPAPEDFVGHVAKPIAASMPDGWAHRRLRDGTAILLVDGVDEVPTTRRREVKQWLRELLTVYPDTKVVVTARTAAADHRWLADERFAAVTLEPMSAANVLAFIERWHEAAEHGGATTSDDALRRLRGQLERPQLRELAATPLLCAMLCALNLAYQSELPRDRMGLYAKALAMLLHLRDAERGITGLLSDTEKRVVLRDLAWRLSLSNRIELSRDNTLRHLTDKLASMPNVDIDAESLLDHLLERSGVLRRPVPGRIDFVHRTFQEYLAADEAVQHHHLETLVGHAHLDTWWETIVMACGHATAKQAAELLTGILDEAESRTRPRGLRLLAAACLETVQELDPAVSARVDAAIRERLVPPRDRRETASLAGVGPRILRYLPSDIGTLSESQAAACVRTVALTGSDDALPLLVGYAQDSRPKVVRELEEAWLYFDPERFANTVLADAPLDDGMFTARSRRLLPHLPQLRHLTSTLVRLDPHERVTDLSELCALPGLFFVDSWCSEESMDMSPLADHPELQYLGLYEPDRFASLSTLAGLERLNVLRLRARQPWNTIEFLGNLRELRTLLLNSTRELGSFDALSGLPQLHRITLVDYSRRTIANTRPAVSVDTLSLHYPADEPDIRELARAFPNTRDANLGGLEHPDLSAFGDWPLEELLLQRCLITDLSPLATLPSLRRLFLANLDGDPDLTPLADLELDLRLTRGRTYRGVDNLGPGVTVRFVT